MNLSSFYTPHPGAFCPTEAATDAPELGTPKTPQQPPSSGPELAAERRYVAAGSHAPRPPPPPRPRPSANAVLRRPPWRGQA